MEPVTFTTLDTSDNTAVERYERSLYRAFRATPSIVLEQIWDFDHPSRRVRAKIPYPSQLIYVACREENIVAGAAMNCDLSRELQLEMIGFSVDKAQPGVCEGLSLFSLQMFDGDKLVGVGLKEYAYPRMLKAGVRVIYGTCNKRRLRGYLNLGYQVADTKVFERGEVYLIRLNFPSQS